MCPFYWKITPFLSIHIIKPLTTYHNPVSIIHNLHILHCRNNNKKRRIGKARGILKWNWKHYIFYIFTIRIGKFKMYEGNILHFYNSFFKSTMINIFHIFFLIRFFFCWWQTVCYAKMTLSFIRSLTILILWSVLLQSINRFLFVVRKSFFLFTEQKKNNKSN